jgi:hypothetical protein
VREIDVVELPLIPFLYPDRLLRAQRRSGIGRYATVVKGPSIPRELWPGIATQVQQAGLLVVARRFGVSHEPVRGVVRRAQPGMPTT